MQLLHQGQKVLLQKQVVNNRQQHLQMYHQQQVVFVTEYKNKVIGFIHAQIYDVLYYESMVNILGLAVDSKFTKNGIGKSLMAKVEEWAKSKKIKLIRLNSGGTRTQAHNFYRNIGFSDEKTQLRFMKSL